MNLKKTFQEQSYAFPFHAFSSGQAARYLRAFQSYEAAIGRSGNPFLKVHARFPKIHLIAQWADEIAHHPAILSVVRQILGPDLFIWSSGIFVRQARGAESLAWHQNGVYYGLDNLDEAVRVWVALTPSNPANGTMKYLPGSHKSGLVPHSYLDAGDTALPSRGEGARCEIREEDAVPVCLRAGEFSLHHMGTIHGSGPSESDIDRVNFTVDYLSPKVRSNYTPDSVLPVGRQTPARCFKQEFRPGADFDPHACRGYIEAVQLRDLNIQCSMKESRLKETTP